MEPGIEPGQGRNGPVVSICRPLVTRLEAIAVELHSQLLAP
jgi:hypothetical protein